MSKQRKIEVEFRGDRYRISPKTAAELNRRGFLRRRYGSNEIVVKDDPYLRVYEDHSGGPSRE